jgi:hypothetical protein
MMVGGDPDYEKLDDQTKLRNFIIPGTDIKIPMNNSAAFFWKALAETAYNTFMKYGTETEMDLTRIGRAFTQAAVDMLLGPEPIPTGIRPFLEVKFKHSFFTGRDITPPSLQGLETFAQWDASTSELGKWMSEYIKVPGGKPIMSPIEADHLVRGILGTVGLTTQWAVDQLYERAGERPSSPESQTPLVGAFTLPEVGRVKEDLFYDLKERVDEKYKTYTHMLNSGQTEDARAYLRENKDLIAMHEYTSETADGLGEINARIRYYGVSDRAPFTPEERRRKMTDLQQRKEKALRNVERIRKMAGL